MQPDSLRVSACSFSALCSASNHVTRIIITQKSLQDEHKIRLGSSHLCKDGCPFWAWEPPRAPWRCGGIRTPLSLPPATAHFLTPRRVHKERTALYFPPPLSGSDDSWQEITAAESVLWMLSYFGNRWEFCCHTWPGPLTRPWLGVELWQEHCQVALHSLTNSLRSRFLSVGLFQWVHDTPPSGTQVWPCGRADTPRNLWLWVARTILNTGYACLSSGNPACALTSSFKYLKIKHGTHQYTNCNIN